MYRRIAALSMLALAAGCARGMVDEDKGSITTDEPPVSSSEPDSPARRISADAPSLALPAPAARASWDDPAGDVTTKDAADIRRVSVAQDKDFMLEVVVETTGSGNVDLYIDSDLKQETGPDGYDVRASASEASGTVDLFFHEGGTWVAADAPSSTLTFENGKLVMRIHRAYLGPTGSRGPIGIAVGTQEDHAPDGAPAERYVFVPL